MSSPVVLKQYQRKDVKLLKPIGEGAFGIVYKGRVNREFVAVKELKPLVTGTFRQYSGAELQDVRNEVEKLSMLRHPNIVSLLGIAGSFTQNQVPWMIFEYMSDGCLVQYLYENSLSENRLIKICHDVCKGMQFLHSKGICHRDLAARNILLDTARDMVKVSDLGMSIFADKNPMDTYCLSSADINSWGIPVYHSAKECFAENKFSSASDVWSFGVTMCEIFNGGLHPFPGMNTMVAEAFIVQGNTPLSLLNLQVSHAITIVLEKILNPERKKRPTFAELSRRFNLLQGMSFPNIIPAGSSRGVVNGSQCIYTRRIYTYSTSGSGPANEKRRRKNRSLCNRMFSPFRSGFAAVKRWFGCD